jgi:hypothetical protein
VRRVRHPGVPSAFAVTAARLCPGRHSRLAPCMRDDRRCFNRHPGNKFAAYLAAGTPRRGPPSPRASPRNMTICRSFSADFCSRRAAQARAASARQTSPVRASSERPAGAGNSLTAKVIAVLRAARLRFLPCFSGENTGEAGVPAPLFAASVGVISSTRRTKRGVSLPLRLSGKNFPCGRSLITAPPGHQPSDRFGRIAKERGPARCPFANLPCRQGKLGKAVRVPMSRKAMTLPHSPGPPTRVCAQKRGQIGDKAALRSPLSIMRRSVAAL